MTQPTAPAAGLPLRGAWHKIRLTVAEMNYAARRVVELQAPWTVDEQRNTRYPSMAMDSFAGKLAVVTGGGSGIGRELVRQLAAQGCSVAAGDLNPDSVAVSAATAWAAAPHDVKVTGHACDVSDEAQVLRFRDELLEQHASDHVDLVFANAGIGGGESFISSPREVWERTFAVDWWGVYNCARTFMPLLIASGDGVLVNTSSVNGLWAALGPLPNSAYSTAKFAVRGFTEGLIADLRANEINVRVALVMPGHVGTDIIANSLRARGFPEPDQMSDAQMDELVPSETRAKLAEAGVLDKDVSSADLRQMLIKMNTDFRDTAPVSAAEAATIILDGVRSGAWRILVGEDAKTVDAKVRAKPEAVYDPEFVSELIADQTSD
jgi:NAD(P)-dependent dehydrogenase (short-subunit alcohol dehydrogenase family)